MAEEGTDGPTGPRDAAVMVAILKEMGVEEYDPNVIHQMLEFSYRKYSFHYLKLNTIIYILIIM